ncbi:hypothetical protein Tbd_1213 [Thiobacillus denitrificans ATCC 25259]|uniref:Uncharacterized protein n=2 Tax=Thiobacillus denitrificans TaxID=36861 RepID=Q3SJJ1_THIDA|nr:hypothetical protein Tbd_1213 [Thiobacillus denitrificans ATCC 25259]
MSAMLDREYMLATTRQRQAKYAALFKGQAWAENELSDGGWLCLIGVPWLLYEMENNRKSNGENRNADCQPRPDCIGPLEPAFQLMLPEQTMADTTLVVPTGNPLAKFLVSFLAKIVGVSFVAHVGARSNVKVSEGENGK